MHRGVIAAAILGMGSPVLLSCSNEARPSDPTPPAMIPSVSVTSPSSTPPSATAMTAVKTVEPPPSARSKSIPGAKAFVRFYITAINSSWHNRTGLVPRRYSTPDCISCRGLASSMDRIRRDNGFYRGGDWIVTSTTQIPLQSLVRPIIHTAITVRAGIWKRSPNDHLRRIEADKMYIDVHLRWSGTAWLVTSMVLA